MNTNSQQKTSTISEDWTQEQQDWFESLNEVIKNHGADKTCELLQNLRFHIIRNGITLNGETLNTPYINSIPLENQPTYPGNIELEKKIENIHKWNAMCMVVQGIDNDTGVGGHLATYASASTMYEVCYNHFFKKKSDNYGGDLIGFQPHASPGIYARAFMEGRFTNQQIKNFRRELQPEGGLSSYPHPRRMPDFWETPSASMGLNPVSAIYQARFQKYLENRGLKEKNGGRVWAFIGDGEMDEPEIIGTINIAAREELDNLTFVVNCNLQRLDGPVRGNGKIIQELERLFLGAGWNSDKVIWGSEWDAILAQDKDGILVDRMNKALDGDYQMYSVLTGDQVREHWIKDNPKLENLMKSINNDQIKNIKRGGHDVQKIFAAFNKINQRTDNRPNVVLLKTLKGDGMGSTIEGRNTAHQNKSLSAEDRIQIGKKLGIPLSNKKLANATLYKPKDESFEISYLKERRAELGGFIPNRQDNCPTLKVPSTIFEEFYRGTNNRAASTTMVLVKIIANLLRDKSIGKYIVPIIPDEARTFGLDGLFKFAGIYQPKGLQYKPVDADNLSYYRESIDGQILQEGICEAGGIASFMAAGTAYSLHNIPTVPFYVFYSMFGFQRVGDMIWACGDMLTKGFLLGGTAGRTTLNGEGVQHQDGHSHVLSSTIPNLKSYDPAFSYELAEIIKDGMYRMYENQEPIFYYITIYNENYTQPEMSEGVEEGIIKGMYRFKKDEKTLSNKAHILASGSIMQQALQTIPILEAYGVSTDIWSVTSFTELSREAEDCERWNMLHPLEDQKKPYVAQLLENEEGAFVAVSDYMKQWNGSISQYTPENLTVLGTDGYGLSETKEAIRDYFEISPKYIALAALTNLLKQGKISKTNIQKFMKEYNIDTEKMNPMNA